MFSTDRYRATGRARLFAKRQLAVIALTVVALGVSAAAASAAHVNIVRQAGPPKGEIPANTHYYTTIQEAVNASTTGDWVLIEAGTYKEAVKVTSAHSGIWIRGMNRNEVIIDGQNKPGNGIEIVKANNVWVDNLTVRNFDTGCANCGNEIWWTGGVESGTIGAKGWYGSYLTTYDTGQNGGYGEFAQNEEDGAFNNIYASGFNDSGFYIGACRECAARVTGAVMENNSLGYSGSNSSGELIIQNSVFKHNKVGIAPNSENPGDAPPPLDGACSSYANTSPEPKFASTNIARCEIIRNNVVEENNNLNTPFNGSTEIAPWGVGIELPGDYATLVEHNVIAGNPNDGVLGFEYANPTNIEALEKEEPPFFFPFTFFFQFSGNRMSNNQFSNNGNNPDFSESPLRVFTGDAAWLSGLAEQLGGPPQESVNDCASGNSFKDTTFPTNIEGEWGCQHNTTPNPGGGAGGLQYVFTLIKEEQALRHPENQAAPPNQTTMPNPCEGVPKNPLCTKGGIISGNFNGPLVVKAGETYEVTSTGKVSGPVKVEAGGALDVERGKISGEIKSNGAALLRLCGAMISGGVEAINTTGSVVIGEGTTGCPVGLISGPTTIKGTAQGVLIDDFLIGGPTTVSGNVSGTTIVNNSLFGPASVTGNAGGTTVTTNSVFGPLTVEGNSGKVVDKPNMVSGPQKLQ
jgi:hypothetical protein